ncbi:phosphoribosylformylglycinamidine synthase subunit PurS [bacterium]|nr:phosphoribosylformylglycinamidine synthase subunit PurS [bacterium]
MTIYVEILPKEGILDPKGRTVKNALHQLDFPMVSNVLVGKLIQLEIESENVDEAVRLAEQMADKLLHNSNVEQYRVVPVEGVSK